MDDKAGALTGLTPEEIEAVGKMNRALNTWAVGDLVVTGFGLAVIVEPTLYSKDSRPIRNIQTGNPICKVRLINGKPGNYRLSIRKDLRGPTAEEIIDARLMCSAQEDLDILYGEKAVSSRNWARRGWVKWI